MDNVIFSKKVQEFEGILKKEGKIAAFGYETGSGDQFHNVVL